MPVACVGGDVVGAPAGRHRAGEFAAVVERQGEVARRVAFAAMRQRLGEIGAAVPLRALRGVGREAAVGIEEQRPKRHRPALIKGERQRVGAIGGMRGRTG